MNVAPEDDAAMVLASLLIPFAADFLNVKWPVPVLLLLTLAAVGLSGGLLLRQVLPRTPRLWLGLALYAVMLLASLTLNTLNTMTPHLALEIDALRSGLIVLLLPDPPDHWRRWLRDRLLTMRLLRSNRAIPHS